MIKNVFDYVEYEYTTTLAFVKGHCKTLSWKELDAIIKSAFDRAFGAVLFFSLSCPNISISSSWNEWKERFNKLYDEI